MNRAKLVDMSGNEQYQRNKENEEKETQGNVEKADYTSAELSNALSMGELKKERNKNILFRLLGNFKVEENQSIITYLKSKYNMEAEEIEAVFNTTNTKINGSIEDFLVLQQRNVEEIYRDKNCEDNQIMIEYDNPIGTNARQMIDPTDRSQMKNVREINRGSRFGYKAILKKNGLLPKTNKVMLGFRKTRKGRVVVRNMIPGDYMPKPPIEYRLKKLKKLRDELKIGKKNIRPTDGSSIKFYTEVLGSSEYCPEDLRREVYAKADVIGKTTDEEGNEVDKYDSLDIIERLIGYNRLKMNLDPQNDMHFEHWERVAEIYKDPRRMRKDVDLAKPDLSTQKQGKGKRPGIGQKPGVGSKNFNKPLSKSVKSRMAIFK